MNTKCITFRSITPAQRAQRILRQNGIEASLQRTPRQMQRQGCGYCLRLPEQSLQTAVALLRNVQMSISGVFDARTGEELRL